MITLFKSLFGTPWEDKVELIDKKELLKWLYERERHYDNSDWYQDNPADGERAIAFREVIAHVKSM